jgi:exosortase
MDLAADAPLKNWTWTRQNMLGVAAAALACWGLLDAVLYCDTSYQSTFGNGRCTLVGLFISAFYNDLRNQINDLLQMLAWVFASIFGNASHKQSADVLSAGSLAGEATASEWTQCLFVPFIVGWMVYWLWPRLRELPVRGSAHGYFILGTGLLLYLLGFLAENYYVGVVSLELVYAGLIVLFLGWPIMRVLFFPLAFLLFMWPYGFFEDVAFQLRLLMSSLSHHTLTLLGVPNSLNGTAIVSPPNQTPPFAIDIADPCSGIRSLFALVMIAALAAFVLYRHAWQKLIILALSVPLVIFGNLVRIILLTLATIHFGEKFALGENDHPSWFHEGAGYVVYLVNFGCLLGVGWLLTKWSADPAAAGEQKTRP